MRAVAWLLIATVAAAGCGGDDEDPLPPDATGGDSPFDCAGVAVVDAAEPHLALEEVASGLDHPGAAVWAPGDERMYLVELYNAQIHIMENGEKRDPPFLDILPKVLPGGERGLLGLAFHPDHAASGRFYVHYTNVDGDTMVEEYTRSATDPDVADPASARTILTVYDPRHNHNGGHLLFGPDGLLYIGLGDGGGRDDEYMNGQFPETLLGNMLRIDVDGSLEPETWAIGLRNPWRYSFDPVTDELYIADVGQSHYEEVDVVPAGDGGYNFGWPCREAAHDYLTDVPAKCPDADAAFTDPVYEYERGGESGSVTGGFVYRGCRMPGLRGTYFLADFTRGWVGSFVLLEGRARGARRWDDADERGDLTVLAPSSFGQDHEGELYVVSYGAGPGTGAVFKIVPAP